MNSNRHPTPRNSTSRIHRARRWISRRRSAVLSSALRGAAYGIGACIVGACFYRLQQQHTGSIGHGAGLRTRVVGNELAARLTETAIGPNDCYPAGCNAQ
ncbi:hypothetical protein ACH4TP_10565 [Streptomyces sp. NPDC021012]|uniref:hypothetical protein n=1 Tax=Streptomyces sp. NPDC021012 TaxID=3365107 RepID=UPI0037A3B09D